VYFELGTVHLMWNTLVMKKQTSTKIELPQMCILARLFTDGKGLGTFGSSRLKLHALR
jgi:hypothetical protein